MAARRHPRQCQRCGLNNLPRARQCTCCGTWLVKKPFRMTRAKIAAVHALAHQKGLDDELYRLRLAAVGVSTCKALKRDSFKELMDGLKKLPDAPGKRAA